MSLHSSNKSCRKLKQASTIHGAEFQWQLSRLFPKQVMDKCAKPTECGPPASCTMLQGVGFWNSLCSTLLD